MSRLRGAHILVCVCISTSTEANNNIDTDHVVEMHEYNYTKLKRVNMCVLCLYAIKTNIVGKRKEMTI